MTPEQLQAIERAKARSGWTPAQHQAVDRARARMIEIEAPDGSIAEFPAGTPDAQIKSVMGRYYPPPGRRVTDPDLIRQLESSEPQTSISTIRQQYPQYQDMSDDQLAGAIHKKYYSDMPREVFDQRVGAKQNGLGKRVTDPALLRQLESPQTKRIQFEGQVHEFPADFSDADISTALSSQGGSQGTPDIAKVKRNIGRMIDQGAPEADIDSYLSSEGVTVDQLKAKSWTDTAVGAAKSLGVGAAKGVIGLAGLPGNVSEWGARGIDRATQAIGGAIGVDVAPRPDQPTRFGSSDIQGAVENVTGKFYEPQNRLEKYAQTVGEFVPAAIGPGGLAAKAGRVVAPALASETAGQATEGTQAEPFARIAAALLGGYGASKLTASKVDIPSMERIKVAGVRGFDAPEVAAVRFNPVATHQLHNSIKNELHKFGARPTIPSDKGLYAAAKEVAGAKTIADLRAARQAMNNVAQNSVVSAPKTKAAAERVIRQIDAFMQKPPKGAVVAGDGPKAGAIISEANKNYSASMRAKKVADLLYGAEIRAGSTYSGGNVNNATRQELKKILLNPKFRRGFSPEEIKQVERVVLGTKTGNAARFTGKMLGGGGGMHGALTLAGSGAAAAATGNLLPLAALPVGIAGKVAGNISTARQANILDAMIRARAPAANPQALAAQLAQNKNAAGRDAIIAALLASQRLNQPAAP